MKRDKHETVVDRFINRIVEATAVEHGGAVKAGILSERAKLDQKRAAAMDSLHNAAANATIDPNASTSERDTLRQKIKGFDDRLAILRNVEDLCSRVDVVRSVASAIRRQLAPPRAAPTLEEVEKHRAALAAGAEYRVKMHARLPVVAV